MNRRGRVRFAWRLIAHERRRSAVAATGIAFAILVIFLQLGFHGAVTHTATAITSRLVGDLVLVSPRFVHLSETGSIDGARLFQVLAHRDVESAAPLHLRYARWRDPVSAETCKLFALGFPLDAGPPLHLPGLAAQLPSLEPGGTLLLDRKSQRSCGPADPEGAVEVREQAARVVGGFDLGVGFLGDGALLVSDQTFARLFSGYRLERAHLGLVRLRPGADPGRVARELDAILPPDVRVLTRRELSGLQIRHWVENTAVGNIFSMGCIAGFFVGLAVLYQILSTDVRNHLPLYATLKAMGYGDRHLQGFVLQQAALFAGLGFPPAFALAFGSFAAVESLTRLPIYMTPGLALLVLTLSLGMCVGAALFSLGRLRSADPAELF